MTLLFPTVYWECMFASNTAISNSTCTKWNLLASILRTSSTQYLFFVFYWTIFTQVSATSIIVPQNNSHATSLLQTFTVPCLKSKCFQPLIPRKISNSIFYRRLLTSLNISYNVSYNISTIPMPLNTFVHAVLPNWKNHFFCETFTNFQWQQLIYSFLCPGILCPIWILIPTLY